MIKLYKLLLPWVKRAMRRLSNGHWLSSEIGQRNWLNRVIYSLSLLEGFIPFEKGVEIRHYMTEHRHDFWVKISLWK